MKDELIINGKKYVHTPEVKEERKKFSVYREGPHRNWYATELDLHISETYKEVHKCVTINEGEIIVSEKQARDILFRYVDLVWMNDCMEDLGFKKDGV